MKKEICYSGIEQEALVLINGGQMSQDSSFAYDLAYCLGYGLQAMYDLYVFGIWPMRRQE